MAKALIAVDGISKNYCRDLKRTLRYGLVDLWREMRGASRIHQTLRRDEFIAVNDLSFEVKRGECLGLIGHNGAGKSTLLKMLTGLVKPDSGIITMRGRVGALIELGAGFNPILTGRENIFVNGALIGMSKKEMNELYHQIVEYAELQEFIDTPVQYYSSGMKVRLGFAIAITLKPDILLIDEVLAVGDPAFRLKCLNTLDHLLPDTAIIFVSHSMPMVSRICTHILMLDHGKVVCHTDDVAAGIDHYHNTLTHNAPMAIVYDPSVSLGECHVVAKQTLGGVPLVQWASDLVIITTIQLKEFITNINLTLVIFDKEQRPVASLASGEININNIPGHPKRALRVSVTIPNIHLAKGAYTLDVVVSEGFRHKPMARLKGACRFQISDAVEVRTPLRFDGHWTIEQT
jgi:lipopolysaccharide transport system ATP-binding protein